jgi:hypothetical protein
MSANAYTKDQSNRKEAGVNVDFNGASGCMTPLVTCKGHPQHRRQTFGICELNESNEVRSVIQSAQAPR